MKSSAVEANDVAIVGLLMPDLVLLTNDEPVNQVPGRLMFLGRRTFDVQDEEATASAMVLRSLGKSEVQAVSRGA